MTDTDGENTTELFITGLDITPFSARGLTQTLEPIEAAASLRRTVNGELLDLSASQLRKYQSAISGNDQAVPAWDTVWPGQLVVVDCIAELAYRTDTGYAPGREEVPSSSYEDGDFTYYRPRLTMRVVSFTEEKDEYGAIVRWTLRLEEV